ADRYRSAKDLAGDLEHWLADEPVGAHAEPWPARLGRWVRHHKGLVGTLSAACLILAAAAIAAGFWDRAKKMEGLRDEAEEQRGLAETRGQQEQIQRERAQENEAGVRRLVYLLRINMADRAWHQGQIGSMLELLEGEPRELRGFE